MAGGCGRECRRADELLDLIHSRTRCAAGDQQYCAYQYTRDNVLLSRQYTGLAVHVIGGSGDAATLAQVADYARAARQTAAAGGSFYDYQTTKPGFWPLS